MAGSLREASEVVRARQWIGAPRGNQGAGDLVGYPLDIAHVLGTLTIAPPPYAQAICC